MRSCAAPSVLATPRGLQTDKARSGALGPLTLAAAVATLPHTETPFHHANFYGRTSPSAKTTAGTRSAWSVVASRARSARSVPDSQLGTGAGSAGRSDAPESSHGA